MNQKNIEINSKLKLIRNKLYFIDIIENEQIIIDENDLGTFFINLFYEVKNQQTGNIDLITHKIKT